MLLLPRALAHWEGSRRGLVVLVNVSCRAVVRGVRVVIGLWWSVVAGVVLLVLPDSTAGLRSRPWRRSLVLVDDPLALGHGRGRVVGIVDAGRRRRVASALLQVLFAPGVSVCGHHGWRRRRLAKTTLDVDLFLAVNPAHRRRRRRYVLADGFTLLDLSIDLLIFDAKIIISK